MLVIRIVMWSNRHDALLVVTVDRVVRVPRIRNMFVVLRRRGRPRSGLRNGSVGADVCTNPTPWPAWAAAPRRGPRPSRTEPRAPSPRRPGTGGTEPPPGPLLLEALVRSGACIALDECGVDPGDHEAATLF